MAIIHHYKGNDGSSEKKRKQHKIMKFVVYVLILYCLSYALYYKHIAGIFVPDRDVDPVTGKERIRRRPERHISKHTKEKVYVLIECFEKEYLVQNGNVQNWKLALC